MKRSTLFIGAGIVLVLATFAVWATSAHIIWTPSRFAPQSIAPGGMMNATVTFKNLGPSTINGKKLSLEVQGEATSIVSVDPPSFPQTVKKGGSVSVNLSIISPVNAPLSVMTGELVLLEVQPSGNTKQAFSDTLPLEITLSSIPVPPDPREEGKAMIEGIDMDNNGVRDDIDRYIVFTYPDSAKIREALKQEARALTPFLMDADDKQTSRGNIVAWFKADFCRDFILNHNLGLTEEISDGLHVQFLNTEERSRAYDKADSQLGGTTLGDLAKLKRSEYGTQCSFNPDELPN